MFLRTLSGRFLLLTIIFVMVAEVMIFVPSVARFREDYLRERLERSQIASLTLLAAPDAMISLELQEELLDNAEVLNIVLNRNEMRELVLASPMPAAVDMTVDLRQNGAWTLIRDAFDTLINGSDRVIRVVGAPVKGGGTLIEATMAEGPLRNAMVGYGWRIYWLSLGLSLAIGLMLFVATRKLIGAPISRVVTQIQNFQSAPEDAKKIIQPKAPVTELYQAEQALAEMETQLNQSLLERKRLVALGGAVSKISHDLRNILTTTQLLADRMEISDDPRIQRIAPKLVNSLSRAVNLCERTLSFGKAEEPTPELSKFPILEMFEDVAEAERLAIGDGDVQIDIAADPTLSCWADKDQVFRVVSNLTRNARQVLTARGTSGLITLDASEDGQSFVMRISDNGPGMPPRARENMFKPFEGSARVGGSGLGLAISAELIQNHNGTLELIQSDDMGTIFEIRLPKAG
ncbi:ATPase [Amylibacter marinus]|uniref:histidine kinase n=1 Tax=Amylibacter marinus TaxID=1475483 RepID=A0ABQ5VUD3_9RHOB|nr:HAMP domain-containing sensor histidine kinase [Amylibacter marinus]GLQ35011.1 ATPase [Amylibacter marinus]